MDSKHIDDNMDEYLIMDNNNISMNNIDSSTLAALGNKNPGAFNVASELTKYMKNVSEPNLRKNIINFILKLLDKNITGSRLWYIYKNEADCNVNNLVELNLNRFTSEYFYEAYEQYL
jgi:hypothetical protein